MTGFSAIEHQLSRMVGEAVRRGVPESAYGIGGMRTVGPLVTLQGDGYTINGERGIVLGRFASCARESIRRIYRDNLPTTTTAEEHR